jgi:RimJ/RimL family protein N-acetyltransferase
MKINFKNLQEIDKQSLIKLMNDLLVLRYMPLASSYFSEEDYTKFIQAKETMWEKYGFGPWAFELEGNLMGWGGLQFFNGEVEIAIVLYPKY